MCNWFIVTSKTSCDMEYSVGHMCICTVSFRTNFWKYCHRRLLSFYSMFNGIIVDEEYTAHVASAQDVEESLVQKKQGMSTCIFSLSFPTCISFLCTSAKCGYVAKVTCS